MGETGEPVSGLSDKDWERFVLPDLYLASLIASTHLLISASVSADSKNALSGVMTKKQNSRSVLVTNLALKLRKAMTPATSMVLARK
jgi:hypothetical protein